MAGQEGRGLGYFVRQLFFWEILQGLALTFRRMFSPKITLHYPEERWVVAERFRGQVALVRHPSRPDKDLCVGCCLCVRVCPSKALDIVSSMDEEGKKRVDDHILNMQRCIFCGMCVEVCPVSALVNTDNYELADYDRDNFVLHKERLLEIGHGWRERVAKERAQGIRPQTIFWTGRKRR